MDSNHLLTHANAVGCTLERRESSTFGRSLISPLLCQGNRERAENIKARAFARRRALTVSGTCFLQMYKNKRETVAVSLAVLVVSERESERNVVKLRRNSHTSKRQSSTESPSPLLSPSLKTETPNRVEGVLRPQLSARSSAAKAFDPKNKNKTRPRQIVVSKSTPASALNLNAHRLSRKMVNIMFCFFTVFSFCGHVYIPDDERRDERAARPRSERVSSRLSERKRRM